MQLNLNIIEARLTENSGKENDDMWFVINVDDSKMPQATTAFSLHSHAHIDFPISFEINNEDPSNSYVYISMCTHGAIIEDIIPVARAKSKLSNLPLDGITKFALPLFDAQSSQKQIAVVTAIGTFYPIKANSGHIHQATGGNTYLF